MDIRLVSRLSILLDVHEGVVGCQGNGKDYVDDGVLVRMKYWQVSMKVQLSQNLPSPNTTSPSPTRKPMLRRKPCPSEGKRLRLTFWWWSP